jgi:putative phage-type endonuclease
VSEYTREQWLAERRTGIGGSDAAAAVGMSKWKTQLELYLDKRGELETAETEPMKWGNLLEPVVRQEYANRTGRTVVVPVGIIRHPTVAFAIMTPDGIADGSRVLQVKCARTAEGWGEPGSAEIPQEYVFQTQHEMFVTQLPVADVAVLIGGSDFRLYEVPADPELQGMLIEGERAFWQRVVNADPPPPKSTADVRRRWQVSRDKQVTADPDIQDALTALRRSKQVLAMLEGNADEMAAIVQGYMQDASELVDADGEVLATWKSTKASQRFDLDRFRTEQPELYKSYLRDAAPQRRFLLKTKGESLCQQHLPAPSTTLATVPQ